MATTNQTRGLDKGGGAGDDSSVHQRSRETGSILILPAEGDLSPSGRVGHGLKNIQALIHEFKTQIKYFFL